MVSFISKLGNGHNDFEDNSILPSHIGSPELDTFPKQLSVRYQMECIFTSGKNVLYVADTLSRGSGMIGPINLV